MSGHKRTLPLLHKAVLDGDQETIRSLLAQGENVNCRDGDGFTPLHAAVRINNIKAIQVLLKHPRINVNCISGNPDSLDSSDRLTPLHLASSYGYHKIVTMLLAYCAKVNPLDRSERTPVYLAVSNKHLKVVKVLLSRGANVNINDIHGYSPLKQAVYNGDHAMVRKLIDAGASINADVINTAVHFKKLDLVHQFAQVMQFRIDSIDMILSPLHALLTWVGGAIDNGSRFNDQMTYLSGVHDLIIVLLNLARRFNLPLNSSLIFTFLGLSSHRSNPRIDQIIAIRKIFDALISYPSMNVDETFPEIHANSSLLTRCLHSHNYYFVIQLIRRGADVCKLRLTGYHFDSSAIIALKMLYFSGFNNFPSDLQIVCNPLLPTSDRDLLGNSFHSYECHVKSLQQFTCWLKSQRCQVMSLKDLARIRVRRITGQRIDNLSLDATLPKNLVNFLLFQE